MVKKVKKKATAKKAAGKPRAAAAKARAKYDQPGAPWWKRVPRPPSAKV